MPCTSDALDDRSFIRFLSPKLNDPTRGKTCLQKSHLSTIFRESGTLVNWRNTMSALIEYRWLQAFFGILFIRGKLRQCLKLWSLAIIIAMAWIPISNVEAKKPEGAEPGTVILGGDVVADDGSGIPKETFNIEVRSGKETIVTIVVRHFWFTAEFAKYVDFYPNYTTPDGATCFEDSVMVSGAYRLFEDGSAEFSTFPEFLTADGEEIQKYHFFLTGVHYVDPPLEENFPVAGQVEALTIDFDSVEITTEGKGQNRRRSCTGKFDDFTATATFSRGP
jgi:hypothetical protein